MMPSELDREGDKNLSWFNSGEENQGIQTVTNLIYFFSQVEMAFWHGMT